MEQKVKKMLTFLMGIPHSLLALLLSEVSFFFFFRGEIQAVLLQNNKMNNSIYILPLTAMPLLLFL